MSTYTVGTDLQAIVADIGSYSTKIGFAGDDHPQCVYNSTTAVERYESSGSPGGHGGNFVSPPRRDFVNRCVAGREDDGSFGLANPVDAATGWLFSPPSRSVSRVSVPPSMSGNGGGGAALADRLSDGWESHELFSRYLDHSFSSALGLGGASPDGPRHHPLLLLDRPHTPPAIRQRIVEILFETHGLPAVFVLRDAAAACYAVGKTTATVVDVGHSATTVTPVFEGFAERRGVLRNNACGAGTADVRILEMMDEAVRRQGGRKRKERMRRLQFEQRKRIQERERVAAAAAAAGSPPQERRQSMPRRDAHGHFLKEGADRLPPPTPIPEYLMPLYQVKRGPTYGARRAPFHEFARMAYAREVREMGTGAAVAPRGYVPSYARDEADAAAQQAAAGGAAANPRLNPANNVFLTSSRVPHTLPDGTEIEVTNAARCDVAELFFGEDDVSAAIRDRVFDETVETLEGYEREIDGLLAREDEEMADDDDDGGNNNRKEYTGRSTEDEAGDPYTTVSYKAEKRSRGVRPARAGRYDPSLISSRLYRACLPHVRTEPPPSSGGRENGDGTASHAVDKNDDYFHYLTSAPPAQMVCDAALRCERDQQASLMSTVVVCGGGSCVTGATGGLGGAAGALGSNPAAGAAASALGDEHAFPERLREEVEAIVHRHTPGWRVKVTSPNASERAICSWLGGSILGSLGTFQDMWISRRDYDELGSAVVNRKCP